MRSMAFFVCGMIVAGCSSQHLATPVELGPDAKHPFVTVVYPEASVYRLLAAPSGLNGMRVTTYGYVRFYWDGTSARLYASLNDAREDLPLNFVDLHFSRELSSKEWFVRFSKQKRLFKGWVDGVFTVPAADASNDRLQLENVSKFDVESVE
jgi:hypothetical protein